MTSQPPSLHAPLCSASPLDTPFSSTVAGHSERGTGRSATQRAGYIVRESRAAQGLDNHGDYMLIEAKAMQLLGEKSALCRPIGMLPGNDHKRIAAIDQAKRSQGVASAQRLEAWMC
jgi:hypothetical protein